jgi:hypothetical protein
VNVETIEIDDQFLVWTNKWSQRQLRKWWAFRKFLHLCSSSVSSGSTEALCMGSGEAWGGFDKDCTNSKCLLLLSHAISSSWRKALIGEAWGIVGLWGLLLRGWLSNPSCSSSSWTSSSSPCKAKLTIQPYWNFDWARVVLLSEFQNIANNKWAHAFLDVQKLTPFELLPLVIIDSQWSSSFTLIGFRCIAQVRVGSSYARMYVCSDRVVGAWTKQNMSTF